MNVEGPKRSLAPFAVFLVLVALWGLAAQYAGWSESAFPGPRAAAMGMWELSYGAERSLSIRWQACFG